MDILEATYKVTTPMFMAGADQQRAELRLPSIKGALRFWWRALAWDGFNGDLPELTENLGAIKTLEQKLFGSSDENVGQSSVLLNLEVKTFSFLTPPNQLKDGKQVVGPGARYLGYGVMEAFASRNKGTQEAQLIRPCISSAEFTIQALFRPSRLTSLERLSVVKSFKALGLWGCIGSKSRKGYGSLAIVSLKDGDKLWNIPKDFNEYHSAINELFPVKVVDNTYSHLPSYTAFSKHSRLILLQGESKDTALSLLDKVGKDEVFFRSWGRDGKVLNQSREENFKDDHDLMKGIRVPIKHPKRVVFGLPHNYGQNPRFHVVPEHSDRRASPLFIHIHELGNHPQVAVLLFMPSVFLKEQINVLGRSVDLEKVSFWQPIDDFINRLLGNPENDPKLKPRKSVFSRVMELKNG